MLPECVTTTRTAMVTALMENFKWPLIEKQYLIARLTMLYKITHDLVEIQHLPKATIQMCNGFWRCGV